MAKWQWGTTPEKLRVAVDAAEQLLIARGYSAVKITDIAEAAGLGTGSLYHHFKSSPRDAIFQVVVDRLWGRISEQVDPDDLVGSYLRAAWHERVLFNALNGDDTPPGFSQRREAIESMGQYFDTSTPTGLLQIALLREGCVLAAACETLEEAEQLIPLVTGAIKMVDALLGGQFYTNPT